MTAYRFTVSRFFYEIAVINKSQTGMNIFSWLLHLAFKNKLFTDEFLNKT